MFAYVRYSDGHKHIVSTEDIKNFDPKNYQQDILYLVRWENSYYKAQRPVKMEEELASPSKQIRIAKILSQDDDKDETATAKEKGALNHRSLTFKHNRIQPLQEPGLAIHYHFVQGLCYISVDNNDDALRKTLKTVEASEKRKSLLQIVEERKSKKRKAPLLQTDPKKRKEEFSDSEDGDDGAVQKIYENLQIKYCSIKKQKQDLQEELSECKQKCAELEKEKEELVAELATYRSLNVTLQQNINEVLQRAFLKTSPSFLKDNGTSTPDEITPDKCTCEERTPDELLNTSSEGNNPPLNQESKSLYEGTDGKVH
ncbi:uncharacterized protein LOC128318425 [Pangasianodon hypophthalmus]|uniref:uncharacterized protein LOC128318425 n=1 Tax=Pangasianodon hypophthalmus TaxID=310915 RepID=UPI0023074646|nr:uncharacterized protein LOC128318425 [Pangasianodon hypophthalmus]